MSDGNNQQLSRVTRIEDKLDRQAIGETIISQAAGGVNFQNMLEVMEFAKLMAISDVAVPKHLRGNPGACLAVCIQAIEWRMSAYAVAGKSYVVNDRISYESQLIHAVVEQRAPVSGRLRCSYRGQGDQRRCKVWASVKGEAEPFEYESAPFGQIQPKNSPLWKTKPDLQLFYNASRDWARMYFPDVILGVYAEDEIEATPAPVVSQTTRGTVALTEKLKAREILADTQLSDAEATKLANIEANRQIEEAAARTRAAANAPPGPSADFQTADGGEKYTEGGPPVGNGQGDLVGTDSQEPSPAEAFMIHVGEAMEARGITSLEDMKKAKEKMRRAYKVSVLSDVVAKGKSAELLQSIADGQWDEFKTAV